MWRYLYRRNVLYVEMCPCARLVDCVVLVDDHDSQIIKRPLFFPTFPALFPVLHECHPKQCWSCRTVREETNICILSVYVCVCLNKVYWGWGSTRGTCNTIPCNASLALHRWKESRETTMNLQVGWELEWLKEGLMDGFSHKVSLSPPPPKGVLRSCRTTSGLTVCLEWDSECTPGEARAAGRCVLIAFIKRIDNLGTALKPAALSQTST